MKEHVNEHVGHTYQQIFPGVELGLEGMYHFKKEACIYPADHHFLLSEIISDDGLMAQRLKAKVGRRHKFVLLSEIVAVYPYQYQHPVQLKKGQKFLAFSHLGTKK